MRATEQNSPKDAQISVPFASFRGYSSRVAGFIGLAQLYRAGFPVQRQAAVLDRMFCPHLKRENSALRNHIRLVFRQRGPHVINEGAGGEDDIAPRDAA